jgi:hypothetical protein
LVRSWNGVNRFNAMLISSVLGILGYFGVVTNSGLVHHLFRCADVQGRSF